MEIWSQSPHVESHNLIIAGQPQSRTQVVEVPFRQEAALTSVDYGEILITIIKGEGFIMTAAEKLPVRQGDQIYLAQGDAFALLAARENEPFIAQSYWAPHVIEQLL